MTELDYIIQNFDRNFRVWRGRRIALSAGEYLEPIVRACEALATEEGVRKKRSVFLAYPFVAVFFVVMILQGFLFGFFDPGTYGMAAEIATEELAGPAFMCGTGASIIVVKYFFCHTLFSLLFINDSKDILFFNDEVIGAGLFYFGG